MSMPGHFIIPNVLLRTVCRWSFWFFIVLMKTKIAATAKTPVYNFSTCDSGSRLSDIFLENIVAARHYNTCEDLVGL